MLNLCLTIIKKLVIGIMMIPVFLVLIGILLTPVGIAFILACWLFSGEDKKVHVQVKCCHGEKHKEENCR